jgi:hypothetical protein
MPQPLWPSLFFGNGWPETVLGPFESEPVKVIFFPAATTAANSGPGIRRCPHRPRRR